MPTYNEIESLSFSVDSLIALGIKIDLLIVDDNSPDGTGALADELSKQKTTQLSSINIFVLHRDSREGLGAAYLAGFNWAFSRDYKTVVEMDADGSHLATDLKVMLEAAEDADLVIGSRWVPGGAVQNWPWYRKFISRAGNRYARTLLRSSLKDMTAGFRAYRVSFLQELNLDTVASRGYAFQVEMALRTIRAGGKVVEVPITFVERNFGRSKMTTAIVLEALWLVTKWSFYRSA